jgi:hypothetical protein
VSLWSKLRGTYETIFQLGKGGPNIKNSSGNTEIRNAADGAYGLLRSLAPTTPGTTGEDVPNMTYFKSSRHTYKVAVALDASTDSAVAIPDSSIITRCLVEITTGYSAGSLIAVTRKGDPTKILSATGDNNAEVAGLYEVQGNINWGVTGDGKVNIAVSGVVPVAGAAVVHIECTAPLTL